MTRAVLEVRGLTRTFGASCAVSALSFSIASGECVGLLGLNGAGKTTTLRMLSGVLSATRGQILVEGERVTPDTPRVRAHIGYLPERPPLYDAMTVVGYLHFCARLRGVPAARAPEMVSVALHATDLARVSHARIASLSHGFRQRVGIAQAIVHAPRLVILDEPSQGLDPAQNASMQRLLRTLAERHAVLLSTHALRDVERCCDRVLLLHEGWLVAEGTEAELSARIDRAWATSIVIEAKGDAARIADLLRAVPTVRTVTVREGSDQSFFEVEADDDVRAVLNAAVVGAGFELLGCAPREGRLDAVFSALSRSKAGTS